MTAINRDDLREVGSRLTKSIDGIGVRLDGALERIIDRLQSGNGGGK